MRVALPYTTLHPETARLASEHLPRHRRYRLTDSGGYARLLTRLWAAPESLLVIEHDIGVHADVLGQFRACPQPWCGFVYALPGIVDAALGCTRFTGRLLAAEPDAMSVAAGKADDLPAGHWAHLDAHLRTVLENRGYALHRHVPPVTHFRPEDR